MACEFTVTQILEATGGKTLSVIDKSFIGVGTDTRQPLDNKIFIALRGDQYDAHSFLAQALSKGAKCLIVDQETDEIEKLATSVTVIRVNDTLRGLQDLARYWRKKIPAVVFAITGSNGKTTTKEYAAAIMGEQFKVHYSQGSYNNHWGVPLTILGISKFHEVALLEMGMNHPGELERLSKIAMPDVVLCTTVGRAHVGNFGGSVQAIADAKEEIYLANPKAKKIFNYDNEFTLKMFERVSKLQGTDNTTVYSSFSAGSEVSLRATHMTLEGLQVVGQIGGVKGEAKVPVFGRHNTVNLMAAASMAVVMKMEPERIWAALSKCHAQWGRGQLTKLEDGTKILFDAYNSNPDSVAMLIKNMFEINMPEGGRKVAVLGEMLELGEGSAQLHQELGELIGNTDFELIWFIGPSSAAFETGFKNSGSAKTLIISNSYEESLALKLRSMLNPSDVVVIKGSRGMKLEKVMTCWNPKFATY
ncbi:MAG: UDP-N-acetylmuramoyl-tripeptide--D-alanyl-D-alanine ligase [Bdellovibrionales bacterium]|nr:UDP-N-acetylmuramoyl-tripeptide--D-alanyl-D-alanine ligase [Bdellovibrionales bacterium]